MNKPPCWQDTYPENSGFYWLKDNHTQTKEIAEYDASLKLFTVAVT